MEKEKAYIEIKFYKLWKHVRITRKQKEAIKKVLYSATPFLFKKLATYQNWKRAQVFATKKDTKNLEKVTTKHTILNTEKLAVVFHVFYLDVFNQMLSMLLKENKVKLYFFVSCPKNLNKQIEIIIKETGFPFKIVVVENHGRDILPFLKILPYVFKENIDIVLKIHTKRSNHLNKKDLWSSELFSKLLGEGNITRALNIFSKYPEVGMIGPAGHILPMSMYYGGNPLNVTQLCLKMGLEKSQLQGLNFVAGSMFFATRDVLKPVLQLDLKEEDFEKEDKQLDNTMAHAIERVFAAGVIAADKILVDTNSTPDKISCKLTLNHPFTI